MSSVQALFPRFSWMDLEMETDLETVVGSCCNSVSCLVAGNNKEAIGLRAQLSM